MKKSIFLLICFFYINNLIFSQTKYVEITFGEPENYSEPNNPFIKGYGFNTSFSFYETSLNEYNSNVQDYFSSTNCSAVDDRYINPLFSPLFDKIESGC